MPSSEFQFSSPYAAINQLAMAPGGTGLGLVRVSFACIDCDDSKLFAFDTRSERLHLIHEAGGGSFVRGSVLLGSAVVTMASGYTSERGAQFPGTLLWTDASGTVRRAMLPDTQGALHDPVAP